MRQEYAIKVEPRHCDDPQLVIECKMYSNLGEGPSIPHVHWWGTKCNYEIIVLDFLGPSLDALACDKKGHLPLHMLTQFADQLVWPFPVLWLYTEYTCGNGL